MKKSTITLCNAASLQRLKKPRVLAKSEFGGHDADLVVLPSKLFSTLAECPYQRNHVLRADTVRYLETASPLHGLVLMTSVNGELRKLDGHTRAEKWADGSLARPLAVFGLVVYCDSYDQVRALYDQVDGSRAAKTHKEKVFGTWRSLGFLPKSEFFQKGSFKTAASAAMYGLSRFLPSRELASASLEFVEKLDTLGEGLKHNTKQKIHPMVVAAALVGVQKLMQDGKSSRIGEIGDFLQLVLEGKPCIDGRTNGRDAVTLLLDVLEDDSIGRGKARQEQVFQGALGALDLWFISAVPRYTAADLAPMDRYVFLGIEDPMAIRKAPKVKAPRITKMTEKAIERIQEKELVIELPATIHAAPTPREKRVEVEPAFIVDLDMPESGVEIRPFIKPNLGGVFAKN